MGQGCKIQGVPTGRPDAGLHDRACHDRLSRSGINAAAEARVRPGRDILRIGTPLQQGDVTMADALSLPIAEIAAGLGAGKLKARALAEAAIANHERFGGKLMAYSQWAPQHARACADAADAAFAAGSRAGP